MNPIYIPGPGDEETWPDEVTHPNDPRWPDDDYDEEDYDYE